MAVSDDASKLETLARLAQSRAEIRRVLEPAPRVSHAGTDQPEDGGMSGHGPHGVFPRSRTMRMLMSGRGIGTLSALVGGLVVARPALAFKLIRMFPTSALARVLMVKAVSAFRSRE